VIGVSEVLVLVLLIACILILPRIFKPESDKNRSYGKKIEKFSVKLRFLIVVTLAYPLGMALFLKPWENNFIVFFSCGVIPVLLIWAAVWILSGKKKSNRKID